MVPVTTPNRSARTCCGTWKRSRRTVTRVFSARDSAGGWPPAGLRVGGPPRRMCSSAARSAWWAMSRVAVSLRLVSPAHPGQRRMRPVGVFATTDDLCGRVVRPAQGVGRRRSRSRGGVHSGHSEPQEPTCLGKWDICIVRRQGTGDTRLTPGSLGARRMRESRGLSRRRAPWRPGTPLPRAPRRRHGRTRSHPCARTPTRAARRRSARGCVPAASGRIPR